MTAEQADILILMAERSELILRGLLYLAATALGMSCWRWLFGHRIRKGGMSP